MKIPSPIVERGSSRVSVWFDMFSRETCVFVQSRDSFVSHMLGVCYDRERKMLTAAQNLLIEGAGLYQNLAEDVWVLYA